MARDLGVQADYVDRAFRKLEEALGELAAVKAAEASKEAWRNQLAALASMQAKRPLKPPGR